MTHTESDLDAAIEVAAEPDDSTGEIAEDLSPPMTIGVDAYISEEYARAERDRLWRKVWQQVGRGACTHCGVRRRFPAPFVRR